MAPVIEGPLAGRTLPLRSRRRPRQRGIRSESIASRLTTVAGSCLICAVHQTLHTLRSKNEYAVRHDAEHGRFRRIAAGPNFGRSSRTESPRFGGVQLLSGSGVSHPSGRVSAPPQFRQSLCSVHREMPQELGSFSNILLSALFIFSMFLVGFSPAVAVATPRHTICFVLAS